MGKQEAPQSDYVRASQPQTRAPGHGWRFAKQTGAAGLLWAQAQESAQPALPSPTGSPQAESWRWRGHGGLWVTVLDVLMAGLQSRPGWGGHGRSQQSRQGAGGEQGGEAGDRQGTGRGQAGGKWLAGIPVGPNTYPPPSGGSSLTRHPLVLGLEPRSPPEDPGQQALLRPWRPPHQAPGAAAVAEGPRFFH